MVDHLVSKLVITDNSGILTSHQRYYSFGATRLATGSMYTDKLFTGQREMAGLGIYHYGSRFYSPKLGRFLSADSIVPNPANPQDFNRYSYVRNNPVRYTDPTGHGVDCGIGTNCVTQPGTMGAAPNPATYICYICSQPKPQKGGGGGGGSLITVVPDAPSSGDPVVSVLAAGAVCEATSCSQELPSGICPIGETCSANNPPDFSINWSGAAAFTQDLATSIDLVFAGIEAALIVVGCSAGGPEGCVAGWTAGVTLFNVSGANAAESYLSGISLAFTIADDFNKTGWFGEASFTSAVTFLIGGINPDPIADLVIDGYASGYNRGIFNDLDAIFFGALLVKP